MSYPHAKRCPKKVALRSSAQGNSVPLGAAHNFATRPTKPQGFLYLNLSLVPLGATFYLPTTHVRNKDSKPRETLEAVIQPNLNGDTVALSCPQIKVIHRLVAA